MLLLTMQSIDDLKMRMDEVGRGGYIVANALDDQYEDGEEVQTEYLQTKTDEVCRRGYLMLTDVEKRKIEPDKVGMGTYFVYTDLVENDN